MKLFLESIITALVLLVLPCFTAEVNAQQVLLTDDFSVGQGNWTLNTSDQVNGGFAAGGGALYAFENEYQHAELFAGIERIIRIRRERFRLGIYGAASESSDGPDFGIKFSLEYFDKQNQNWGF